MRGDYVDAGGINTYVIDEGVGPVVVLLHGAALAVDAYVTWFRTIEALKTDYRVISFDQIGFGRTDMPADGQYRNRLQRVDHALAVLDTLDIEDACLVGHSEGAFMAARMAIVRPGLASGLVLITTGGTAPYLGGDADADWVAASIEAYNDPHRFDSEEAFVSTSAHLCRHEDAEYEAILRENYQRAMSVGQDQMFKNLPSLESDYLAYGELQNQHVLPYLADVQTPALLIWSTDDRTVPVARGLKLLGLMPSAELHVIRDAAHNVMHDQPRRFHRALTGFCRQIFGSD